MSSLRIEKIDNVDLKLVQRGWSFAQRERAVIDVAWAKRVAQNPTLWNGEVLIAQSVLVQKGKLSAEFSQTDYASFVVWRDLGWPDKFAFNIFGMGVLTTSDGALVYGEMNSHTVNPGMIYPPGGSLEPRDVLADGCVDIDRCIAQEIAEEVGIDVSGFPRGERFAVFEGQRVAVVQSYQSGMTFDALNQRFKQHVARDSKPELVRLVAVQDGADLEHPMPGWAQETARLYMTRHTIF